VPITIEEKSAIGHGTQLDLFGLEAGAIEALGPDGFEGS